MKVIGHLGVVADDQSADVTKARQRRKHASARLEALIESTIILDYLDELVGSDKAMLPRSGAARSKTIIGEASAVERPAAAR